MMQFTQISVALALTSKCQCRQRGFMPGFTLDDLSREWEPTVAELAASEMPMCLNFSCQMESTLS